MVASSVEGLLVTSILFTTLSFIVVASRLVTRCYMIRNPGADDVLAALATASSIGFLIVIMYQIKYGLGTPFRTIPPATLPKFFQSLWATIPIYNLALTFVKLSIVCQYKRIFSTSKKLWWGVIGILIVYGLWTVLGSTFMCIPVQHFWGVGEGRCMNRLIFWFTNAALNIVTDIILLAMPIPLIRALQLPSKQKLALMIVFTFGLFVCITSVIRLRSLYLISVSTDTSLDGVPCAIWSGLEINIAIICSSLATLRPLLGRFYSGLRTLSQSNHQLSVQHNPKSSGYQKSSISNKSAPTYHMNTIPSDPKSRIEVSQTIEIKDEVVVDGASERQLLDWDKMGNTHSSSAHGSVELKEVV